MKKIIALLLASILLLSGCGKGEPDAANSGKLAAFPNPDAVYSVISLPPSEFGGMMFEGTRGTTCLVNGKGETLLDGVDSHVGIIHEGHSYNAPKYLMSIRYPETIPEGTDWWESSRNHFRLYSLDGEPVTDYINGSLGLAWGDFITYFVHEPSDDEEFPMQNVEILMNIKTGEVLCRGHNSNYTDNYLLLNKMNGGGYFIVDKKGKVIADTDKGHCDFIYDSYTDYVTVQEDFDSQISVQAYFGTVDGKRLIDKKFAAANATFADKTNMVSLLFDDTWTLYSLKNGSEVEKYKHMNINYFDGERMLLTVEGDLQVVADKNCKPLSERYDYISPVTLKENPDRFELFTAYIVNGKNPLSAILDRNGKVIFSATDGFMEYSQKQDRIIHTLDNVVKMYDRSGKLVFDSSTITTLPREENITYVSVDYNTCDVTFTHQYSNLYLSDVYTMEGKLIIANARQALSLEDGLYDVSKGFDSGIINRKGEWVYKTSAFANIDGE